MKAKAWKPNYKDCRRTRLEWTVWGQLRYDWGRWYVMNRIWDCTLHPSCIARVVSGALPGWRYADKIHRFVTISRVLENGPLPHSHEEWDDFNRWFVRTVPRCGDVYGLAVRCVGESPADRIVKFCGRRLEQMTNEELFKVASLMFEYYCDRMYPNAFNGAKLCIETVKDRCLYGGKGPNP